MSQLHTAIINDRVRRVQLLLNVGMNVNKRDKEGRTPLMLACFMSNLKRRDLVCELLQKYNADTEALDAFGRSLVMYACATRNKDLLERLLEYTDSDINHTDKDGNTCLMYAAIEGDTRVLTRVKDTLRQYGISIDVRNKRGFTAYLLALKYGNVECANILRENGASCNILDFEKFWDGEQWMQEHYLQRIHREGMQLSERMRSKSTQTHRRNKECEEAKLIQRPRSLPPMFEIANNRKAASRNTDVRRYSSYGRRVTRDKSEQYFTNLPRSGNYEDGIDKTVSQRNKSATRPHTVSSFRSEAISALDYSEMADSVSLATHKRPKSDTQRKELIKIFEQYSLSQNPVPPPAPKDRVGLMRKAEILKKSKDSPGFSSPKGRRRNKGRNFKADNNPLTAIPSSSEREKSFKN